MYASLGIDQKIKTELTENRTYNVAYILTFHVITKVITVDNTVASKARSNSSDPFVF